MSDDVRLDLLRDAISRSDLDGQTKDALADDLRYAQQINRTDDLRNAQQINGADDQALQGIKRLLISNIRRELLGHERIKKAIAEQALKCAQMRGATAVLPTNGKWYSILAYVVFVLKPVVWPVVILLSVIAVSPHAGAIIEKVINALN